MPSRPVATPAVLAPIDVDLSHPIPGASILRAMVGPRDPQSRAQVVASAKARTLEALRRIRPEHMREDWDAYLRAVESVTGIPVDLLRTLPIVRSDQVEFEAHYRDWQAKIADPLIAAVLRPGALEAILRAPDIRETDAAELRLIKGPLFIAGRVLVTLGQLKEAGDRVVSLRNASALLAEAPPSEGGLGVNSRTLERHYEAHREVAPLWAAAIAVVDARQRSACRPEDFTHALAPMLENREASRTLAQWALWFRRFALEHRSKRGREDALLLPPSEAVEFRFGVPEEKPALRRLSPGALKFAARLPPPPAAKRSRRAAHSSAVPRR